jgi:hypothetical protein
VPFVCSLPNQSCRQRPRTAAYGTGWLSTFTHAGAPHTHFPYSNSQFRPKLSSTESFSLSLDRSIADGLRLRLYEEEEPETALIDLPMDPPPVSPRHNKDRNAAATRSHGASPSLRQHVTAYELGRDVSPNGMSWPPPRCLKILP